MAIRADEFLCIIGEHMKGQPYKCTCAVCGFELKVGSELDIDFDLIMDVEPCPDCMKEASDADN